MDRKCLRSLIMVMFLVACFHSLPFSCEKKKQVQKGKIPVVAVGSQWYGHIPVWVEMEK